MEVHVVRALSVLGALIYLLSNSCVARADPRVFALIVSSNRGTSIAQPPLQYADDDGVRYLQLFAAATSADSDALLLTRFDDATRAAYSELENRARPPVLAELKAAVRELGQQVQRARERGESTALYFVFAGHGEVREGRGYLGLEDGAMDGDFIEHELIERIPADTTHVILDSCNSFFVINPRKPGGRRWATPDDMAFGFSARHPEVGVFLSTNTEEEVYEWSRLEAGVFSHEVRSGMRGAADVDSNGHVSYGELAGFVTRANQGIVRESLRPHLFYRGPKGARDATLFSVAKLRGNRLTLDPRQTRGWVADARGERVLDLHKEPGPLTVVLPSEQGELSLIATAPGSPDRMAQVYALRAEHGTVAMTTAPLELAARGERMFGELFSQPYGRDAYAAFGQAERAQPKAVFGLSASDTERADHLLEEIASVSEATRRRRGAFAGAFAVAFLGTSAVLLTRHGDDPPVVAGSVLGGIGVLTASLSAYSFLSVSAGEMVRANLHRQLIATPAAQREAFLSASGALAAVERKMIRRRRWLGAALLVPALFYTLTGATMFADSELRSFAPMALSEGMLFTVAAAFQFFVPTAAERLIRVYRRDPQLSVQFSANASNHGASLGLRRQF